MKAFSPKRFKKIDPRQAEREARKAANSLASALDNTELLFIGADGSKYYVHKPISVEGYTPAF